jgi:hypothetical protein
LTIDTKNTFCDGRTSFSPQKRTILAGVLINTTYEVLRSIYKAQLDESDSIGMTVQGEKKEINSRYGKFQP